MAPGRVKKFLASLPFGSAARSRRSHESHSDPVTAETAAAEDSNPMIETTSSPATFRMDPEKAKEYLAKIEKFRVLVMGRANSGKTTILQRVCNTVEKPDIFDAEGNKIDSVVVQGSLGRGYHNIEHELVFKSNPGFIFHDSSGFEAGSAQQFDEMKKFVIDHAAARTLQKRIHAIWYCIPMTDYQRTVTAAEQKFFNECDTGHVPVVVLLTKVDALHLAAIEELLDEGLEMEEAKKKATERETLLLEKWQTHIKQILDQCQFPPKMYLALTKMHNESADCTTLIQSTASALNEEGLQRLLISTQQSSIGLCIEYAVYWVVGGMIRDVIERGERYDIAAFESAVLSWFPKHSVLENFADFYDLHLGLHLLHLLHLGLDLLHLPLDVLGRVRHHVDGLDHLDSSDLDVPQVAQKGKYKLPLPKVTTFSISEHGVYCLLIFEYCYFLLQNGKAPNKKDVIALAVKEYKSSGIKASIHQAVKSAVQQHGHKLQDLCQTLVQIILENRLSHKIVI